MHGKHLVILFCFGYGLGCRETPSATRAPTSPASHAQPKIFVADWANHRIVRISDMQGGGWTTCDGAGAAGIKFHLPVGVCADQAGRIYVSEQYHQRIFRFDDMLYGGCVVFTTVEGRDQPVNRFAGSWICVDGAGRIYVSYDGQHRVARLDHMNGNRRVAFGREGSGAGEFRYPAGIAVDESGRIYVADFDNFRIVRFDDMEGSHWTELGSYGSGRGQFINPCGIALDKRGRIYIADQGNDRIVRIDDLEGTNWVEIGEFGAAVKPGLLYAPTGIAIDGDGRIYVTQSSSNHRLVRMDDMSGTNWTTFGHGGTGFGEFASPMGICVRP